MNSNIFVTWNEFTVSGTIDFIFYWIELDPAHQMSDQSSKARVGHAAIAGPLYKRCSYKFCEFDRAKDFSGIFYPNRKAPLAKSKLP